MEKFPTQPSPEQPELSPERLEQIAANIEDVAGREGMAPEDIESDMMTFASMMEDPELANPEYFEELSERVGVPAKELIEYALKRLEKQGSEE